MIPAEVPNLVAGEERPPASGTWLEKMRPADGEQLCRVARSGAEDARGRGRGGAGGAGGVGGADAGRARARSSARSPSCCATGATRRASSSPPRPASRSTLALGEADAAVEMGLFVAGEGRRSYGRTTTASMPHRTVLTVRRPVGVAALLISFNTPLPNVAWKAFPSIFCGNGVGAEAVRAHAASRRGGSAGSAWRRGCRQACSTSCRVSAPRRAMPLVEDPRVDLVCFTGSAATGRAIAEAAGRRLAKTVMELGGKNALVVCDDADLERAVEWTLASAFSNAGQRCAAASRIVVFDAVYDGFRERLGAAVDALGEIGPVISEASLERILGAVEAARADGATVLARRRAGRRPRLARRADRASRASRRTRRSPARSSSAPLRPSTACGDLDEAVALVNDSPYGLTAAIHTASVHRAMRFAERVAAGVVVVNAGTHGSEPHMGFGGVKQSGTGWKEAGVEALDVYSETQYVNLVVDPALRERGTVAVLGLGGVGGVLAVAHRRARASAPSGRSRRSGRAG